MAARSTGDAGRFAGSGAAHRVSANEVAFGFEFWNGLEFGGHLMALALSAQKRRESGTPARRTAVPLQPASGPHTSARVGVSHERNAGFGTQWGSRRLRSREWIPPAGSGGQQITTARHESPSCVNVTINFRQPRCPLDFDSGGMESRQSRRFLLKSIEETAQCIVTIPD
jgi:hypothetical protein